MHAYIHTYIHTYMHTCVYTHNVIYIYIIILHIHHLAGKSHADADRVYVCCRLLVVWFVVCLRACYLL